MKQFTENARYEYPLNKDSIMIDLGCHKGTFSKRISDEYGCNIFAFEPVEEFYREAMKLLEQMPNIKLFNVGIGSRTRRQTFGIKGDMTGAFSGSETIQKVKIVALDKVIKSLKLENVDLLKINIEGGEFEVLEHAIAAGLTGIFANIQVQFHPVVRDYGRRYDAIRETLLKTHQLTYDAPWCWENYERNK